MNVLMPAQWEALPPWRWQRGLQANCLVNQQQRNPRRQLLWIRPGPNPNRRTRWTPNLWLLWIVQTHAIWCSKGRFLPKLMIQASLRGWIFRIVLRVSGMPISTNLDAAWRARSSSVWFFYMKTSWNNKLCCFKCFNSSQPLHTIQGRNTPVEIQNPGTKHSGRPAFRCCTGIHMCQNLAINNWKIILALVFGLEGLWEVLEALRKHD